MPVTALSAKNAQVTFNGSLFQGVSWEVTPESNWEDATTFEDLGFENQVPCLRRITARLSGLFTTDNPYDDGVGTAPVDGTSIINLLLYLNDTTSPFWSIALADVISVTHSADVHRLHTMSIQIKGTGAFIYPVGAVT